MDKKSARIVALKELERLSCKPMEEIDIGVETLASLKIDLEQFLNAVVPANRRGLIVHDYEHDSIQTILDRTM
jgi:hypothetical protein